MSKKHVMQMGPVDWKTWSSGWSILDEFLQGDSVLVIAYKRGFSEEYVLNEIRRQMMCCLTGNLNYPLTSADISSTANEVKV